MGRGRRRRRPPLQAGRGPLAQRRGGDLQITTQLTDRASLGLGAEARRRLGPVPSRPTWPLVSIVVLNRDGLEHLRRLLTGLVERTDYPCLELIVVDNASTDGSLDFLRTVEAPFPISLLANAHNESFADACNQGAAVASGELLLFLNNDVEPFESGWLRELVACLHGGEAVAVGPTLIHPGEEGAPGKQGRPGRYFVHQRGLRLAEDEAGRLIPAYRDHLDDPLGDGLGREPVEAIALIAACLLIERPAFDTVGGFSSGYWYGPEDLDLGLKLRERGMRSRCSGRSLLIHRPNTSLDEVDAGLRREWMRGNRRLFGERWGPRVRREFELDRLADRGLWAEPAALGPGPDAGRSAWEELGFCLRLAAPAGERCDAAASFEVLRAELGRRGRRCLALRGPEVDALPGLEYDVAVHLKGRCRYQAPAPAQLNVLWGVGGPEDLGPTECAPYDLVAVASQPEAARLRSAGLAPPIEVVGAGDAVALLAAVEARARETEFRTRVDA